MSAGSSTRALGEHSGSRLGPTRTTQRQGVWTAQDVDIPEPRTPRPTRDGGPHPGPRLTLYHLSDLSLKVLEAEGGQEAQGAQVERHDRRHAAL